MSSRTAPRHRAAARRRLPRVALGAAVATVAVVVLLGGSGSLAFWRSNVTVSGGSLKTGTLALTPSTPSCSWSLTQTGGTVSGAPSPNPLPYTGQPLQPNDTVVGTCTTTVQGTGDHLTAQVSAAFASPPPAPFSTSQSTITVNPSTPVSPGATVTLTATLVVPSTDTSNPSADASNVWTGNLLTATATQVKP